MQAHMHQALVRTTIADALRLLVETLQACECALYHQQPRLHRYVRRAQHVPAGQDALLPAELLLSVTDAAALWSGDVMSATLPAAFLAAHSPAHAELSGTVLLAGIHAPDAVLGIAVLRFAPGMPIPTHVNDVVTRWVAALRPLLEPQGTSLPDAARSSAPRAPTNTGATEHREQARLAALDYLHAVQPDADVLLQRLVDDVRDIFGTDLCMLNLVTADMQYFRAWSGDLPAELADARQDPRERSMCQYVVDTEQPLIVPDFGASDTFHDQYFCLNYGIRFYAGTPLTTSDGHTIGSLCLLHGAPRTFSNEQRAILDAFARAAVGRIEVLGALARERAVHQAKDEVFGALRVATHQDALRLATELQRTRNISLDIIVIIGFDGVIKTINPACHAILGYTPDELIGRSYIDLVHPNDVHTTAGAVGTAVRNFENRYMHKDGGVVWLEWNARPVADEQVMYCVARDITERKRTEAALRASEERLRTVVTNAPVVLFALDAVGVFTLSDGQGLTAIGSQPHAVVGRSIFDVYCTNQPILASVRRALAGELVTAVTHVADGVVFETRYTPVVDQHGAVSGVIGVAIDISERVRVGAALQASEARHRAIVNAASDAIITMSADGIIQSFNPGAERIFGYAAADAIGQPLTLLMPSRFRTAHTAGLQRYVAMGNAQVLGRTLELAGQRHDGTEFPLELTITHTQHDVATLFVGILRDITERKAVEAQLQHHAFHDPLTGLPNRALFVERLQHTLQHGRRPDPTNAVLFLDLDRFKVINDSLGHVVGDHLLCAVAARLQHCVRPHDTVARFGGDEFTLLLEDIADVNEAVRVAQRIADAIDHPFMLAGHELVVTVSIGIALSTAQHDQPNDLLRAADLAMYRAKHRGRARYEVFDPSMNAAAMERLQLEAALRRALERDELTLYYQPKVDLATGAIVGMEALVRWQHPTLGLVSPATFIPLAEETGLILPLGRWVLETACRQAARWQTQYPAVPLVMSVNLSPRQFQHPALIDDIVAVFNHTGVAPECVQLEITESVVVDDVEANIRTLQRLKAVGVQLAIDDFGTGYSSLSYLKRFPIDTLKIDKSFVDGLGRTSHDAAIVHAIITLAHALDLDVTAEGVETAAQATQLRQLGCDLGQGYYWAPPLPSDAAGAWVARAAEEARVPLLDHVI